MDPRLIAGRTALAAGLCWVLRWLLSGVLGGGALSALHWLGVLLFALSLAALGAGLVSSSAAPLRALVAVALPLLVWSVAEVVRPAGDTLVQQGLLGLVAAVAGALGSTRGRRAPERAARRRTGSHAA